MTDFHHAKRLAELQQQIATLESAIAATPSLAALIQPQLADLHAQLQAVLGPSGVHAEMVTADQGELHGNAQQVNSMGSTALSITASTGGSVTGNTQVVAAVVQMIFGQDARPDKALLLERYFDRLLGQTEALQLERLARRRKDDDKHGQPAITLDEVFFQLITDAPAIETHQRQGTWKHITTLWDRYARRYHTPTDIARPDTMRVSVFVSQQHGDPENLLKRRFVGIVETWEKASQLHGPEGVPVRGPDDATPTTLHIVRPELALEAMRQHRLLVLLGEPGGGKSTLLRFLAQKLAHAARGQAVSPLPLLNNAVPIPIFVALGQLDRALSDPALPPMETLLAALRHELDGPGGLSQGLGEHLLPALSRGALILLLDGLDELPAETETGISPRGRAAEAIRELARLSKGQIVVTSRIVPYEQPGSWQLTQSTAWTRRTLEPLLFGQVREFIQRWYHALRARGELPEQDAQLAADELIATLHQPQHRRTREMLRTPLLLTMLTLVHYNRLHLKAGLPSERVELYEECVDLLLHRWEPVRGIGYQRASLLERLEASDPHLMDELRELVQELAFCAHHRATDGSQRGRISRNELQGRLTRFFTERHMPAESSVRRFLAYIQAEVGLLQAESERQYVFPHLTFQEYLAACYAAEQLDQPACHADDRIADATLTIGELLRQRWAGADNERWRTTLLLLVERFRNRGGAALRSGLHWILTLAAAELGGQQKPQQERLRDAALAALSYDAIGAERAIVAARMSLGDTHKPIRQAIVSLLQTPDASVSVADRVAAGFVLGEIGDPRPLLPEQPGFWCDVAAGVFWFGDDRKGQALQQQKIAYDYKIGRYPITNLAYKQFLDAQGGQYDPDAPWWTAQGRSFLLPGGHPWDDQEQPITQPRLWNNEGYNGANQPVVGVSWYEAAAYCAWLTAQGRKAGWLHQDDEIRLPTAVEWERAARHTDKRHYPWDPDEPTGEHANYEETGIGRPAPVGCFPKGVAACGAEDLAGNVWEWTSTLWEDGSSLSPRKDFTQQERPELRGGAFWVGIEHLCCGVRNWNVPSGRIDYRSFRVVLSRAHG